MRILTVANFKGGVGKTTTSVNMAYILSEKGYRTLIVDADPQGNSTYFYSKYEEQKLSLLDVLQGRCSIKKAIRRTRYRLLDILPSNILLESLQGITENTMLVKLHEVEDLYDFVIIDCQPSFQINTINALVAADDLIVPVKVDRFGLNGLELMKDQLEEIKQYNPDINFIGCLVTMYRPTKTNDAGIIELVERTQYPICDTAIHYGEAVNSSIFVKKPLLKHKRNSNPSIDYVALVDEYLRKVESNGIKHQ